MSGAPTSARLVAELPSEELHLDFAARQYYGYCLSWWRERSRRNLVGQVGIRPAEAEGVAFTLPENERSQKVMRRLGMSYVRDFERHGLPHLLYRVTPAEWVTRTTGR